MRVQTLLFLVHRIPYPPNKGDKIRSFNQLKALSKKYRVFLGTFIDDPADKEYLKELESYCEEVFPVSIDPAYRKLLSLSGIPRGLPLSVEFYKSSQLRRWVRTTIERENIEKILCFSAAMAQFVMGPHYEHCARVIDFVDVDSAKWREYAKRHKWPMSLVYARESTTLLNFERRVAEVFDVSTFVTEEEAALFRSISGISTGSVRAVENGVDTRYFAPDENLPNPYSPAEIPLVFTGAMDYWANVDAVTWFANKVFPRVKSEFPELTFWIVGTRPTVDVKKLASNPAVSVTGAVDDIRPYLEHAKISVAPLRIARGVQNKVLEAMAMAKPVVATSNAVEGIALPPQCLKLVADDIDGLVAAIRSNLENQVSPELGAVGRAHIVENHDWAAQTDKLIELLEALG